MKGEGAGLHSFLSAIRCGGVGTQPRIGAPARVRNGAGLAQGVSVHVQRAEGPSSGDLGRVQDR